VFQNCGYRCELLSAPDQAAFLLGKEFGTTASAAPPISQPSSDSISPQSGSPGPVSERNCRQLLVFYRRFLRALPLRHVCCRVSACLAERRLRRLQNLRFQQDDGVKQKIEAPGLKYTIDFGLGMLKAVFLGDVLNDLTHNIRAYEVNPGETNRVMDLCVRDIGDHMREFRVPDLVDRVPGWFGSILEKRDILRGLLSFIYKIRQHLRGKECQEVLERCRKRIDGIAMDRTKLKPVVKIIGEFWRRPRKAAATTGCLIFWSARERKFQPEALGTWIGYLLAMAKMQLYPGVEWMRNARSPDAGKCAGA